MPEPEAHAPAEGEAHEAAATLASSPELGMMALRIRAQGVRVADASTKIEQADRERQEQIERQREAEEAAREAEKSSSFWGDVASVAKVTAIVGSAAAAVATGGSTLVVTAAVAGAMLQAGGEVAKATGHDELARDMEYAGAGASLLAGGAGVYEAMSQAGARAGAEAAKAGASAVEEVGKEAGQQAGQQAAEQAATSSARAWVRPAGLAVAGAGTAGEGGANAVKGHYDASGVDAHADAVGAGDRQDEAKTQSQEGLDDLRRAEGQSQKALQWAASMVSDRDHARAQILAHMRG